MFINLVKKSFFDIIKNPIITLLLVTYFIGISVSAGCIATQRTPIMFCLLSFTTFLFIAIFISGWLRVVKEISIKEEASDEASKKSQIALFLEGIGENVIPSAIGLIVYVFFSIVFAYAAYLISIKLFGNPRELLMEIQSFSTPADSMEFIKNLPQDKLLQLYIFPLSLMFAIASCSFAFLYYFISMAFDNKSSMFLKSFVALKNNFCFLFKHFFMSLGLYLFLCLINAIVVIVKAYMPSNVVIDILYIFYVIYFMSFAVMLICNYYGKQYSCNNGPDGIGENESNDNVSEEN